MATIPVLEDYIRFQLTQLSGKNGHHTFEDLCLHLTRQRICSNVMPATGPVGSGGDQGRDFESFPAHLESEVRGLGTFVGLISERCIVFACSLQTKIVAKIRKDVSSIAGKGRPVDAIYYFCSQDVPVSKRHELQEWAGATHEVDLEIFDGRAIGGLLADPGVLWIADRFLGVPAEMYPTPSSSSDEPWYGETLASWRSEFKPSLTFSSFAMAKAAIRHATTTADCVVDVPFWLRVMETFQSIDSPIVLAYRATYEKAVASLRAFRTMEGLEDELRSYFAAVPDFRRTADLEDASCLVIFCHEAFHRQGLRVELGEVFRWTQIVISEVEKRLAQATTASSLAELMDLRGHLESARGLYEAPTPETRAKVLGETIHWWQQAADLAKHAPLFPLERFSDRLSQLAALIGDDPGYPALMETIDALVAKRSGDASVADKARKRALSFYAEGRFLRAIRELHEAKVRWYARETLEGAVHAMLFVADCYRDLGLEYAAKYYALAAANTASGSDDPNILQLIPHALTLAGECDYRLGNWISFLGITDLAIKAHSEFSSDPGNFGAHRFLESIGFHSTLAVAISELLDPQISVRFAEVVESWGPFSWLDELLSGARNAWQGKAADDVIAEAESQLRGLVLGDIEPERNATWRQLGLTWSMHWPNLEDITFAAEQFVAILQIALTDFASEDLLLLPTTIDIEVSIADIEEPSAEPEPSNEGRIWRVVLPRSAPHGAEGIKMRSVLVLGAATAILHEVSLLPDNRFVAVLDAIGRQGILTNILVGRSYEQLARDFTAIPEPLNELLVRPMRRPGRQFLALEHPELAWRSGPGAGWSERDAQEAVERRYQHAAKALPWTIAKLRQDASFLQTVETLREDGWKDWHILLGVGNVTWNYRAHALYGPHALEDRQLGQRLAYEAESEDSPEVPVEQYSAEKLRSALQMSMINTLVHYGLELRQSTPDLPAIEKFLASRYFYWDIDIPHTDPFSAGNGDASEAA